MKTIAKILLPIIAFANTSLASEDMTVIRIKPTGKFDFSMGVIDNKGHNSTKKISTNHNKYGFLSQGRFTLNVKNQLENNISYGAQIALNTTSRSDRTTPSHLFFESDAGKWEFGPDKSVMTKMKITGYTNASATGGMWDVWVNPDINDKGVQYVTNASNFLDSKMRSGKQVEYSRKISYYSPKISGFQLGVSYVPDTSNNGGSPIKDGSPDALHLNKIVSGYSFDIKDGVALALTKEHKFSDKASAKISVVTEFGKVVVNQPTAAQLITAAAVPAGGVANPLVDPKGVKFKKLQTYNIGAELKYGRFAISGGYANFMKSLTANNPLIDPADRKKSYLYSVGAKYSFEKLSMSTHYFYSDNKKNTISATTFGIDYKLAPGLMPYAEVTAFNAKGAYKALNQSTNYTTDNHHGGLFIVGIKLEF